MHTLKLILKPTKEERRILEKRFRLLCRGHNVIVKHAKKLLAKLRENKEYQAWLEEYKTIKDKEDEASKTRKKELSDKMTEIRESIGLTKAGLQAYAKVFQKNYKHHISSQMMQKESDRVWEGVEEVIFGNGKDIHFKKHEDMHSLPSKSTKNGIRYYDEEHYDMPDGFKPKHKKGVEFLGLDIRVKWGKKEEKDDYKKESIEGRIKYATLTREMFPTGWHYYVVLTIEGPAPKKLTLGKGTMGGDHGPSTIAVESNEMLMLETLSPDCAKYNDEITRLQRKIDKSTRLSNPDNYNEDGTIKKGKKRWKYSKTCLKDKRRLKTLLRKKADYTRHEHNERANRIVSSCDTYVYEEMNFKALAKRSKNTERQDKPTDIRQKDGTIKKVRKYKRRKRFGKSILDRSPGYQVTAIEQKMKQYGGTFLRTDTAKVKASQYNHADDTHVKPSLSERMKEVGGHRVQRDLYSAFITRHAAKTLVNADRESCIKDFDNFIKLHDKLIAEIKAKGEARPASFGF